MLHDKLTLGELPYPHDTTFATWYVCKDDSVFHRGQYYKPPAIVYDTLKSSCDCDSLIVYQLKETDSDTSIIKEVGINYTEKYFAGGEYQSESGVYYDTFKNWLGCDSIVITNLIVQQEEVMFIPDAFTPNGDGRNDILYVRGVAPPTFELIIFSQWGEEVFTTTDMSEGWDGTFNGEPLPMGNYVYMINAMKADGEQVVEKGVVALIR